MKQVLYDLTVLMVMVATLAIAILTYEQEKHENCPQAPVIIIDSAQSYVRVDVNTPDCN